MGFEPTYNGFANRCLTTWLPRRKAQSRRKTTCSRLGVNHCHENRVRGAAVPWAIKPNAGV